MYFLDANDRFVPFNFFFSSFSMKSSTSRGSSFCCIHIKTCLPFLVIKTKFEDSFTLEIPTPLFFSKPTVHLLPSPLILNCITLCHFLQLLAEGDYSSGSPFTLKDKKCIEFLSAFAADTSLNMPPNIYTCHFFPSLMHSGEQEHLAPF